MPGKWYPPCIFLVAILSGLLIGYPTAVIAGALPLLDKLFHFSAVQEGVIVSAILIGGFFGALSSNPVAQFAGQKPSILITCLIFISGSILNSFLTGFVAIVACRFYVGLAVGAITMLGPLYVAELSDYRWRGLLVSSIQLAVTIGIFLAYLSNYYFAQFGSWSAMFALAAIPAVLLFVLMLFLDESPRWLLSHGQEKRAKRVYHKIYNEVWEPDYVEPEIKKAPLKALFRPLILPVTLFAMGLFVFQNLSGIDAILYYAPNIFKLAGFADLNIAFQITMLLGLVNILATVVSMMLIDRLGRRPILIAGLFVMTLSLLLFGGMQVMLSHYAFVKWLNVGMLFLFLIAFAMSIGPIPYVMMSELFPLKLRITGMSIIAASAWGINALVTFLYPVISQNLGLGYFFLLFAFFCFLALLMAVFFCPETKGRSLEHIEKNLVNGCRLRDLGQ